MRVMHMRHKGNFLVKLPRLPYFFKYEVAVAVAGQRRSTATRSSKASKGQRKQRESTHIITPQQSAFAKTRSVHLDSALVASVVAKNY